MAGYLRPLSMPRAKAKPEALDKPERIAKVMARAGLCSRREAERWIEAGRVKLDGKVLESPAVTVTAASKIIVDGEPLPLKDEQKVWRYHKPAGLLTTHNDPEGRPNLFDSLPEDMPRVISVGRLDLGSEGLLLLTNDGELARQLELPASGWLRRYRVRVHGRVDEKVLDELINGVTVDGVRYKSIQATLDRQQGANAWLTVSLIEGKNREIRRVMEHLGWTVSRLIRTAYGPFQLGKLAKGEVEEVRGKVLKDQLSGRDRSGFAEKSKKAERRPADKRTERSKAGRPKKNARKGAKIDPINQPKKENAHRRRQK
ncbi:MAG: rRNA pseudouridine synthase [Rhodospirillaceae bacterium]|jgi:23S rRNA pseudouridine2605 synthase|nr:rRNA pseudouridine synthase [Rhodospirillaceae bacterium]MBT7954878.1 rRNA pseudouridine synthase [Rhodospirillaceae bacterium]